MRMNVLQQESSPARRARCAGRTGGCPLQLRELVVGIRAQFLIVLGDFFAADGVQIIHRGVQADRAGDVRRAGFELVRRFFPGALVEIDVQNHFAAALVRRHCFQTLPPAIQHADAGRPAHFVAGEREEIAADFLHIERPMAGALRGVHQRRDAAACAPARRVPRQD